MDPGLRELAPAARGSQGGDSIAFNFIALIIAPDSPSTRTSPHHRPQHILMLLNRLPGRWIAQPRPAFLTSLVHLEAKMTAGIWTLLARLLFYLFCDDGGVLWSISDAIKDIRCGKRFSSSKSVPPPPQVLIGFVRARRLLWSENRSGIKQDYHAFCPGSNVSIALKVL